MEPRSRSFVSILALITFPLLLTLLPLWFLHTEAGRERERGLREEDVAWFSRTERAAQRLKQASHPGFWTERGARRVRVELEKAIVGNRTVGQAPTGAGSGAMLPPASSEAVRLEADGWRFWGCSFPGDSPEGKAQAFTGPGFSAPGRGLMTQTLQEIAKAQVTSGIRLGQEPLSSRLRNQFGVSISSIHFQPDQRGRAFAVVMDSRLGYAVWELIKRRGRVTGIILAFMPVDERGMASGLGKTLAQWRSAGVRPAFFPLVPGSPGSALLADSEIRRSPEGRRLLRRVLKTIGTRPGPHPNGDLLGRISLPVRLLHRPLRYGDWRFRLVVLDQVCGHLGLLCQPLAAGTPGNVGRLRDLLLGLCLAGWGMVVVVVGRRGRLPGIGVRAGLVLWFAGVVAVPVVLGFSSGVTMLRDREKTLTDSLHREIEETLAAIDRESVRIRDSQALICRRILDRPERIAALRRCQLEQRSPEPILHQISVEAQAQDITLRTILLFGFGGYSKHYVAAGWSPQTDDLLLGLLDRIYRRKIDAESPPMPLSTFPPPEKMTRTGSLFMSDLSAGLTSGATFDRVEVTELGGIQANTFHTRLRIDGATWFIIALGWTQERAFNRYLEERLTREQARSGSPRLTALRIGSAEIRPIPADSRADLVRFARKTGNGKTVREARVAGERHLYVALPSARMPGFVLAARKSLRGVESEIAEERRALHLLAGTSLGLVLMIVVLLSGWLAGPIVRISRGLVQIADGDLDVVVAEARQDELGQAAVSLDAMTRALRERRQLSRFVPPQVLEIAAGGDPGSLADGRKQTVTVLATDMRSFTTLSERHPPDQIFRMLNRHLEAMTRVIQAEGGIIDRFIGDAIVAVFPAGPDESRRSAAAVRAAQGMMRAHAALIEARARAGEFPYAIGIGLDCGEVVAGVLGDPEVQLDFSVLGEPVARAGDLEALSKHGTGSRIVASDAVRRGAGREFAWRPLSGSPGKTAWELEMPGFHFPEVPERPEDRATGEREPVALEPPDRDGMPDPAVSATAIRSAVEATAETADPRTVGGVAAHRDRPVGSTKSGSTPSGSTRPGFALLAIAAALWALPMFMVWHSWDGFSRSMRETASARTLLKLQDDLRFVEHSLDPGRILTLELRRRLDLAAKRTLRAVSGMPSHDRADRFRDLLPAETRRVLDPLRPLFPSMFWLHDVSKPPPLSAAVRFEAVPTGSEPLRFSRIGDPETSGHRLISGGRVAEIRAAGLRIHDEDHLGYLWRPMDGDGTFTVKLADMISTNWYSQAMVMMRESLASRSRYVRLGYMDGEGPVFGWRDTIQAMPLQTWKAYGIKPPFWMRLSRQGQTVVGAVASDGVSWQIIGSCRFPATSSMMVGVGLCGHTYDPGESSLPQVVHRHGCAPAEFTDEDCWLTGADWRWLMNWRMTGTGGRSRYHEEWARRRQVFPDVPNLEILLGNYVRQVFPTTLAGRIRQFYGHPFLASDFRRNWPDLEGTVEEGTRWTAQASRHQVIRRLQENLLGMLWLGLDPEDLTMARVLPMFRRELKRRGIDLEVSANPGPVRPFGVLPVAGGRLRIAGTGYLGSDTALITISRPLETTGWGSGSGREEALPWAACLGWIVAGLILGGRWAWWGVVPALSLQRRLLAGFLFVSLPLLLCSWLIFERAAEEANLRLIVDARASLLEELARADSGKTLWDGALLALSGYAMHRAGLGPILDEYQFKPLANPIHQRGEPSPVEAALKRAYEEFVRYGFRPGGLSLFNTVASAQFPPPQRRGQDIGSSTTRTQAVSKFFIYLLKQTSERLGIRLAVESRGPISGSPEETMIGAEFEGFSQGLGMILGAARMAELTLAPMSFGRLSVNSEGNSSLLRRNIWSKGRPVADLQMHWTVTFAEPRQLTPLFIRYPDLLPKGPLAVPCDRSALLWLGVPPMLKLISGYYEADLAHQRWWKSPAWFEIAAQAANRNEPVMIERGTGEKSLLMAAFPGKDFGNWIFTGEIDLGAQWTLLASQFRSRRLLLFGMLLLAVLLAHRVAIRFLEPAAALVAAADRVRSGDYQARLDLDRTDEFGVLAQAFNRMARSAEEGRLLGKFVPATARALAADDEASQAARAGEARQVIVLFAGLAGFKKRLASCEPEALILWLNRHLEAMSRAIRAHGGETNKFIGDKVLAVFFPAPGRPLSDVVPGALAAAQEMRRRFSDLAEDSPNAGVGPALQLGVGLVAGPVLAGILGTESVRLEFTVIGDTVNLASRLSDLASNQPGGAVLVERELVLSAAGSAADAAVESGSSEGRFQKVAATPIKGKTRAIEIFRAVR